MPAAGRVAYARDAFDGLHLMDKVTGNGFDDYLAAVQSKRKGKSRNKAVPSAPPIRAASPRWTWPMQAAAAG